MQWTKEKYLSADRISNPGNSLCKLYLLMQNSIHSRKEIKTFWKNFEKMLLVVHLSFLHARQLLMKLLLESLQTFANLMLGLMPAHYIPTRCVNPCLPVSIRVGISIQKRIDSHLDKKDPHLWEYGHVLVPTNKTRMWNWKLLYNRQTEESWQLQCWWVLFTLQHCVRNHGLLSPLLSLSRAPPISHWRRYQTW